jgi:HEAT repeat protein
MNRTDQAHNDGLEQYSKLLLDQLSSLFTSYNAILRLQYLALQSNTDRKIEIIHKLSRAHQTKSSILIRELVWAFAKIHHEATVPFLLYQLQNNYSEEEATSCAAAEALGTMVNEDGVRGFVEDFRDDESPLLREAVRLALEKE